VEERVTTDIWSYLEAGGMSPSLDGLPASDTDPRYNPLLDPAGARQLGVLMAERVRHLEPSLIVVWDDLASVILGCFVAAHLGVPVLRVYDSEGLLRFSGTRPERAVGLMVGDAFRDLRLIRPAKELLEQHDGRLAGAVGLVTALDQHADGDLVVIGLIDGHEP
jgi:hypothetical protein